MRAFKTPQELIREGYDSEAALVFLGDFFEEEKAKQLTKIMNAEPKDLLLTRDIYKYISSLEQILIQKVEIGIRYATEYPIDELDGTQKEDN